MKKDIHPDNYRLVVFKDMSNGDTFITKSCADSKETIKIDGTLIIEHNKFLNFKNSNYFYMSRKYGDINFSFFKYLKK